MRAGRLPGRLAFDLVPGHEPLLMTVQPHHHDKVGCSLTLTDSSQAVYTWLGRIPGIDPLASSFDHVRARTSLSGRLPACHVFCLPALCVPEGLVDGRRPGALAACLRHRLQARPHGCGATHRPQKIPLTTAAAALGRVRNTVAVTGTINLHGDMLRISSVEGKCKVRACGHTPSPPTCGCRKPRPRFPVVVHDAKVGVITTAMY